MRLRRRSRIVLVTGASGFLGRHLVRSTQMNRWQLIAPSSSAMDITVESQVMDTITGWEPDVVIHLAYRTGDRRSIVDGSRHVALGALGARARLVHVSTDALFAGRPRPYSEADVPDPITPYGVDKRDAEVAVRQVDPSAVVVRTSLLYGTEHPSDFQRELAEDLRSGRRSMTLFSDEFRCPAHADDVADALLTLAADRDRAGTIHVAGPDRLSRVDFAAACARFAGFDSPDFPTTTIAASGDVRPGDVALDTSLASSVGIGCRRVPDVLG